MTDFAFDTHRFVKRLTEAGMPERQAEILAEEQARLVDEKLVTKTYFDGRLDALEYRLTLRVGGMVAVAVSVVAALVKLL